MGVTFYSTFMGGFVFLEKLYEWVRLFTAFVWVGVDGSGWV